MKNCTGKADRYQDTLKRELYAGICPVDVSWTCSTESFFSRSEFFKIVERCKERAWGVNGLEVFRGLGQSLDVAFSPVFGDRGATWCRGVLDLYLEPDTLFSATFFLRGMSDDSETFDSEETTLADFAEVLEQLFLESRNREVKAYFGDDLDEDGAEDLGGPSDETSQNERKLRGENA